MDIFCVEAANQIFRRLKVTIQFLDQLAQWIAQALDQSWLTRSNAAQVTLLLGFLDLLEQSNRLLNIDNAACADISNVFLDKPDSGFGIVELLILPIILKVVAIKFGSLALCYRGT